MNVIIDHDPATGRVFAVYPSGTAVPTEPGWTRLQGPADAVFMADDGMRCDLARLTTPVPETVQMWQARVALKQAGLFDAADAAVKASGNLPLQTAWEYGNTISRGSPGMVALGQALGLAGAQIDQLFRQAAAVAA